MKIAKSDLSKYFTTIVIAELVGIHKPHPDIFHYAVTNADTNVSASVMVGDSLEADIRGAQNVGMDAVFFNPNQLDVPQDIKRSIVQLDELTLIL